MAIPEITTEAASAAYETPPSPLEVRMGQLADTILQLLADQAPDRQGRINFSAIAMVSVQRFATELPHFLQRSTEELARAVEIRIRKKIAKLQPEAIRQLQDKLVNQLFDEINYIIKHKDPRGAHATVTPPTFNNGSRMIGNYLELNTRSGTGKHEFRAGIFKSGDYGIDATPFAAYRQTLADYRDLPLHFGVSGGIGTFAQLGDFDTTLGVIPSLRVHSGLRFDFGLGELRLGGSASAMLSMGIHRSTDFYAPLEVGTSLRHYFSRATVFTMGFSSMWIPTPSDIQDVSLTLFQNSSHFFTQLDNEFLDFGVGVEWYNNEIIGQAQLSRTFEISQIGGRLLLGIAGRVALEGTGPENQRWSSTMPSAGITIGYERPEGRTGVRAYTTINTTSNQEGWHARHNTQSKYKAEEVAGALSSDAAVGQEYECKLDDKFAKLSYWCSLGKKQVVKMQCVRGEEYSSSNPVYRCYNEKTPDLVEAKMLFVRNEDVTQKNKDGSITLIEQHRFFKVSSVPALTNKEPVLKALVESKGLSDYIAKLAKLSDDQIVASLSVLAQLGYDSYNDQGLQFVLGNDTINRISLDDMFNTIQLNYKHPEKIDRTTVCRGIAKLITHIAHGAGFEAHNIAIQTKSDGHVVSMIRKPGRDYQFINYGNVLTTVDDMDMTLAVTRFANVNGYPPQTRILVYDHTGAPERNIVTNEGQLLEEATVPSNDFQKFLRFRD